MTDALSMTELYDYTVQANNGETGKVHDFSFDDGWAIRYLVVDIGNWVLDTGKWISGKKVVVSAIAFEPPQREMQLLPVTLSKEEVELCPEVNTFQTAQTAHLYSAREIIGYRLQALDDEIGYVKDFIIDPKIWLFAFIVVTTDTWWPSEKANVAPVWVKQINSSESTIYLDLPGKVMRRPPAFDAKSPSGDI